MLFLLLWARIRKVSVPCLISYSTGTLLAAAFFGTLPAALDVAPARVITATVLAGIMVLFVLKKLVLWRDYHDVVCKVPEREAPLVLISNAFHNFVDGVVIAAAFLNSIELGIIASLAVIAHETPQEAGNFAIFLDNGYIPAKLLLFNTSSAATTLPGALIAYLWLAEIRMAVPYILAISAAGFIYVAIAELILGLHRQFTPLRPCASWHYYLPEFGPLRFSITEIRLCLHSPSSKLKHSTKRSKTNTSRGQPMIR